MIDRLCNEASEDVITVAGFYCDFRNQKEKKAVNIIGVILKHIVTGEVLLEHMRTTFEKASLELGSRGL